MLPPTGPVRERERDRPCPRDPGLRRRQATASRHLAGFGVAMYCGFGRQPGKDGMQTMRDHRQAALAARE